MFSALSSRLHFIAGQKPPMEIRMDTHQLARSLSLQPALFVQTKFRRVLRGVVTKQLKEDGHLNLADSLNEETETILPYSEPVNDVGEVLHPLIESFSKNRFEELQSMCERESLSQYNARSRFRGILKRMTSNTLKTPMNVHQFVTVMAFTGHVAVHCANHNMEEQLVEVVDEAEKFLHEKQPIWIPTSTVEVSSCGYFSETHTLYKAPKHQIFGHGGRGQSGGHY